MDFTLVAPVLYAQELAKPSGEFLGARGTLTTKVHFFGPPDHARAEGTVVAKDLAAFGAGLGSGTLALTMDRTTMTLKGPVGSNLFFDGRVIFEGDFPFAVGVSASTPELGRYVPSISGLKGSLVGKLFSTGTLVHYEEARADLRVAKLVAGKGDWDFSG